MTKIYPTENELAKVLCEWDTPDKDYCKYPKCECQAPVGIARVLLSKFNIHWKGESWGKDED